MNYKTREQMQIVLDINTSNTKHISRFDQELVTILKEKDIIFEDKFGNVALTYKGNQVYQTMKSVFDLAVI
jgi:predicted transcriptional regulator